MTKPSLLELPPGVQLRYLAEGGANVIYRFVATPVKSVLTVKRDPRWPLSPVAMDGVEHGALPARLKGKLLRLRKETAADLSYTEIVHNFNTIVRPLFQPQELVDQTLVRLPEGLIQQCNKELHMDELSGKRPKKRHGGFLCPSEPFGLLITDMTTVDEPGATLAELKPKWLIQSPSAPDTAHRCRTCALREMKNHDARSLGLKEQRSFCPLDLVSEHFEDVLRATAFIKGGTDRARLARILFQNPILHKLQSQQKAWSRVGLYGPPSISQPSLDMTLRDCTMFIKIPSDEKSPVEIRLGDLDLKTGAGGKAQYWRDIELHLLDGGWYCASNSSQDPSECALQYLRVNKPHHILT
ncbi:Inositol-pentakisphosphate 2-kinase [Penicillium hispanicum]|uniref:Inositol-pentakisphosphate 2-kinase n=1 Tax=Penicillium hispanicum TaxID=1080232 RepID=UPI00253FC3FB|nr:Inositol-pentakisphosphate 2-kinase [Penicillium hispanicum]KAJ5584198.1 Inositol-pentakisphosphate 2-kinase [Penicillium hispanicum]